MKTVDAMLSLQVVALANKQVSDRTDVSSLIKSTFEATLANNSPRRAVISRTDATAKNEPGIEQGREQRRRHFGSVESPGETTRVNQDEGLSEPPGGALEHEQGERDFLLTITSCPVATSDQRFSANRESVPVCRSINSRSVNLRSPDFGRAVDAKREDIALLLPVKVSEQQTHFLPTSKHLPDISFQAPDLKGSVSAQPVHSAFKEALEPRLARHESGHMPNAEAAEVALSQTNSTPLQGGSAALQVLSAVLADSPSGSDAASRVGAGVNRDDSRDLFAGSYYRTISIQLQPASMGLVQVVLRSTDRALSVRIEVESSETQSELDNDRKVLAERISAAGYLLDELHVMRIEGSPDGGGRAPYEPPAFDKAGGSAGSGSDNTQRRPRTARANLRQASDVSSAELPSHAVPESNRGAAVSGLRGPGQRLPRLV